MSHRPFLVPEKTCWRIERAERMSIILDGADYFRAVKHAMLAARHTIMMIGWDFDTRIEFEPEGATLEGPNALGPFMKWMADHRENVDLYMLKWDLGALQALGRGMVPMALRPIRGADNFHFKFDTEHPAGSAHHSKIIVIDDRVAFCGGIDVTAGRWDTSDHLDDQPHRRMPGDDTPSKPWHDVTTAVSGPLAAALGDLARQRWLRATGTELTPPEATDSDPWPDLEPTLSDLPVAIARTYPDHNEHPEVREIEALYLAAIAGARRSLYIESQYLASPVLSRAIATRLAEADGPEVVLVLPETSEGWLRQKAMDGARKKMLRYLWANDPHDRFRAYYPVTAGGASIYVHAKVLIMDDRLLRIGSSNLNNRSMGFDTECDVAVDAADCPDPEATSRTFAALRAGLVAEHLGATQARFEDLAGEHGLIGAIERLAGPGKSLRAFDRAEVSDDDSVIAENEFADPEGVEGGLASRLAEGLRDMLGKAQS